MKSAACTLLGQTQLRKLWLTVMFPIAPAGAVHGAVCAFKWYGSHKSFWLQVGSADADTFEGSEGSRASVEERRPPPIYSSSCCSAMH